MTILSHMHTDGPWLEGNIISYSCPSGLKIAGTNTSTCMDNGQWEPHPSDITCTGNHNYIVEPVVLLYVRSSIILAYYIIQHIAYIKFTLQILSMVL